MTTLLIILGVIIVVLVLLLAKITGLLLTNVNLAEYWYAQWKQGDDNYIALEQGRDEESEAYEQQYLSFMETIENQAKAIDGYIEDLHFLVKLGEKHFEHCLPEVYDPDLERYNEIKAGVLLEG